MTKRTRTVKQSLIVGRKVMEPWTSVVALNKHGQVVTCPQWEGNRRCFIPDYSVRVLVTEIGHHPAEAALERVRVYCERMLSIPSQGSLRSLGIDDACREILAMLPPVRSGEAPSPVKKGRK